MSFVPKLRKDLPDGLSRKVAIEQEFVSRTIGKTIVNAQAFMRKIDPNVHESNVLKLEFNDGSILWIQTASNAINIISDFQQGKKNIKPSDFHADLFYWWEQEGEE